MKALQFNPDNHYKAIVIELQISIKTLERCFAILGKHPLKAEQHDFAARHS
jgi:hypothetical protein